MKFKKVLAGVLAVTSFSLFSFGMTTIAEESVTLPESVEIYIEDTKINSDKTFESKVYLKNLPENGILGAEFAVFFNSKNLVVNEVVEGDISITPALEEEGGVLGILSSKKYSCLDTYINENYVSVLWSTGLLNKPEAWLKEDGLFLTIKGTVLDENVEKEDLSIAPIPRVVNNIKNEKITFATYINDSVTRIDSNVKNGIISMEQNVYKYGDINLDGSIDNMDLVDMCRYLIKETELNEQAFKNADVVSNGVVDVADLALLKQYILGDKVELGVK